MASALEGTVFFGGIGTSGGYVEDMLAAFSEAGIKNPAQGRTDLLAPGPFAGGALDKMLQGLVTLKIRNRPQAGFSAEEHCPLPAPRNLVGYSFGSLVAAQSALALDRVENLVLLASPISGSFLEKVKDSGKIQAVHVLDLTERRDPIRAGMKQSELLASVPVLARQYTGMRGHFWYAKPGPEGRARRRELALRLKKLGLR